MLLHRAVKRQFFPLFKLARLIHDDSFNLGWWICHSPFFLITVPLDLPIHVGQLIDFDYISRTKFCLALVQVLIDFNLWNDLVYVFLHLRLLPQVSDFPLGELTTSLRGLSLLELLIGHNTYVSGEKVVVGACLLFDPGPHGFLGTLLASGGRVGTRGKLV